MSMRFSLGGANFYKRSVLKSTRYCHERQDRVVARTRKLTHMTGHTTEEANKRSEATWTSTTTMASTGITNYASIFAPSTTAKPSTSPKDSTKDVTVPSLPDLHNPSFLDVLLPEKQSAPKSAPSAASSGAEQGAAFMAAMKEVANRQYTENSAHGFASTGSPTVDAFNGLSQATEPQDIEPLLRSSWKEDPLLTLKIIFNLRSIHEGKSEREGFYRAWGWLYRNHPRTAIANLSALVDPLIERKLKEKNKDGKADQEDDGEIIDLEEPEVKTVRGLSHGYWKDLLNLLTLASNGQLDDGTAKFTALHPERTSKQNSGGRNRNSRQQKRRPQKKSDNKTQGEIPKDPAAQQEKIAASLKRDEENAVKAKSARNAAHAESRAKVETLFKTSKPFQALYIATARLFANQLALDVETLAKIADPATEDSKRVDLSFQLSLAAKYAPSIATSHDRSTNIASAIAELLWAKGKLRIPHDASSQQLTLEKVQDLRSAYTRWVLSPIRRFLQIPEIYMSSNRWNELPYRRVASTCMQKSKSLFYKHDEPRFSKYLMDVAAGKRSISGATLLPHTLLAEALGIRNADKDLAAKADRQVIEAQWKTMVDKLRESGALDNSMALCDVSGSMGSIHGVSSNDKHVQPILPAVALSIVLSQVSRQPWANSFITFSSSPQIVKIDPDAGLVETAKNMVRADWGMNTDFNAVFTKLILPMAIQHKLPKEEMIKRLFVFSDMEFDASVMSDAGTINSGAWTTEHEKVAKAFEEAGYDVPEIVYWNLQGARGAKPVMADWEGVSVMSGFSSNMLKVFMEEGTLEEDLEEVVVEEQVEGEDGVVVVTKKEKKKMTPEDVMKKALNKPSFGTLVVVD